MRGQLRSTARIICCLAACAWGPVSRLKGQARCLGTNACDDPTVASDTALPVGTVKGLVVGWLPAGDRSNVLRSYREMLVIDQRTGRRVQTDERGRFTLSGLAPGPDTLTVAFIGYTRTAVAIDVPRQGGLQVLVVLQAAKIVISHDTF